jgi:hypothetical protein
MFDTLRACGKPGAKYFYVTERLQALDRTSRSGGMELETWVDITGKLPAVARLRDIDIRAAAETCGAFYRPSSQRTKSKKRTN